MKKLVVIMIIAGLSASMCSCSNKVDDNGKGTLVAVKEDVIYPDNKTVKYADHQESGIHREPSTENMEEVAEKDEKQEQTQYDNTAKEMIRQRYEELGISGEIKISDKMYMDTDIFLISAEAEDTTLAVQAEVNTVSGEITVYEAGSVNGSEYVPVAGTSRLQCNVELLEEYLYNNGFDTQSVVNIISSEGYNIVFTCNGEEYEVTLGNGETIE